MRLRNVKCAKEILTSSSYFVENPSSYKGKWKTFLPSKGEKICLEIGCGKGDYLLQMAQKYPEITFIGMEKYESVLVRAVQKAENTTLPNLKFLCMDAKNILDVFDHEIDTLYLNFSDPWPKNRHAKRRLTSLLFLELYDGIFEGNAHIIQKTDNDLLFASSLECFSQYGYVLQHVCLDLVHSKIPNVMSEYEKRFVGEGVAIKYVEVFKNKE